MALTTEARTALRAWLLAAPVFLACSAVPAGGLGRERGYVDVDLYGTYAEGLLDGRLPYRDVFVEYPPGAFVVLVPPALVRPAAGKTGTTDDHADAWFAGYTPDLTTVVWVGYPQGEIPMESVPGISVSRGTFPAEIWRLFMQRALWESEPLDWVVPAELPEWVPWDRGEDVLSYDPYAKPETTEDTTTEKEPAEPPPPPPPPPAIPE